MPMHKKKKAMAKGGYGTPTKKMEMARGGKSTTINRASSSGVTSRMSAAALRNLTIGDLLKSPTLAKDMGFNVTKLEQLAKMSKGMMGGGMMKKKKAMAKGGGMMKKKKSYAKGGAARRK